MNEQQAKLRKTTVDNYYTSPNFCRKCGNTIEVQDNQKVAEVRRKKFCNQSCAISYNNSIRPKKAKPPKPIIERENIGNITKGELFSRSKNWQTARSIIRRHAKDAYVSSGRPLTCSCGYDKHIDIAHNKSVSEFGNDTPIKVINDVSNLLGLCPNCHWEFDNRKEIKNGSLRYSA